MISVEHNPSRGSFISGQTVTRDALGRAVTLNETREGRDTITHTCGYNLRGELISDNENVPVNSSVTLQAYTYAYDATGNRTQAWNSRDAINSAYTANNLNQDTAITEEGNQPTFTPAYDEEGNQTQIRTGTGNWQVTYNADNRPVTFTQGARRIENKYDYQGRRVEKALSQNGQLQKRLHFIYNGYLQIAALDTTDTTTPVLLYTQHWDPTEPVATRPLVLIRPEDGDQNWYEYTHTLNKNIANLTDKTGNIVAHYDYDPYGNQTEQTGPLAEENPFRYSSEYFDEELGLIYYNYRHYNPKDGRWINRDPISESGGMNLYGFAGNNPIYLFDILGLVQQRKNPNAKTTEVPKELLEKIVEVGHKLNDLTRKNGGKEEFCVRICKKCNGEYYHAEISGGGSGECSGFLTRECQKGDKDAAIVHSHPSSGTLDISAQDRKRAHEGWPPPSSKGSEYKLDKNLPIATVHSSWENTDKPTMLIYQPNKYYGGLNRIQGKTYRHDGNFSREGKYSMKDGRRFDFKTANFI